MNINTSQAQNQDGRSYFALLPRRVRPSTDSTDVSPSTTPKPFQHHISRGAHGIPPRYSISEQSKTASMIILHPTTGTPLSLQPKIQAPTIAQPRTLTVPQHSSAVPFRFQDPIPTSVFRSTSSSQISLDRSPEHPLSLDSVALRSFKTPSASSKWTRTHSGGVWVERRRTSLGNSGKRFDNSSESTPSRLSVLRSSRDLSHYTSQPLRPPRSRGISSSTLSRRHTVKLEKAFSEARLRVPEPSSSPSRKVSLRPKDVVAATVRFARMVSNQFDSKKRLSPESPQFISPVDNSPHSALNHTSVLKQTRTANVLQRVTSILHAAEGNDSPSGSNIRPPGLRILSDKSTSNFRTMTLSPHILQNSHNSTTLGIMPRRKSSGISDTSSIRKVHLGPTPAATPNPDFTYRFKRSPSAETEEFFKVDISIRGGTSYLPSEARRIHTPPLPREDAHREVRGCVVDCSPSQSEARGYLPEDFDIAARLDIGGAQMSSRADVLAPIPIQRTKESARDWFEMQLTHLGRSSTSDDMDAAAMAPSVDHSWQPCLVTIDWSIPEHLPSSPLCPLHRRYWRAVQEELREGENRVRVCWMHGRRLV